MIQRGMVWFAIALTLPLLASAKVSDRDLVAVQEKLGASQARVETLQHSAAAIEQELSTIQRKLLAVTAALRKKEAKLYTLEAEQEKLRQETRKAERHLQTRRTEIEQLLQSLIRLARTPPEAVVAMPGELRTTLQTANILRRMTDEIRTKTRILNTLLTTLQQDRAALVKTEQVVQAELAKMELAHRALDKQLHTRQKLYQSLNRQQAQEKRQSERLSRDVSSLQELMAKLEQQRKRLPAHAKLSVLPQTKPAAPSRPSNWKVAKKTKQRSNVTTVAHSQAAFSQAKGKLNLPVIGKIVSRFGEKVRANETHKGLTIQTRSNAQVVSPVAGKVVFTGPFLEYGQMVIVRYKGGYHLLMAGLEAIQCETGQEIPAGAPVGRIGKKTPGKRPALYLELRHGSKAIDPAPWFG